MNGNPGSASDHKDGLDASFSVRISRSALTWHVRISRSALTWLVSLIVISGATLTPLADLAGAGQPGPAPLVEVVPAPQRADPPA